MAENVLARAREHYHSPASGFSSGARAALENYQWPGNIRELQHVVERSVLLAQDVSIGEHDLLLAAPTQGEHAHAFDTMTLEQAEVRFIQEALRRHLGNANEAARSLGISRSASIAAWADRRRFEPHHAFNFNLTAPRTFAADVRLVLTVLSCAIVPAVLLALEMLGIRLPQNAGVAVLAVSVVWIAVVAFSVRGFVLRHLRTLSNLIETTRMQDYSLKASRTREPGELASLYRQINALSDRLKVERQGEKELLGILETVISQINVAIIVCDSRDKILLANLRAFKLLGLPPEAVIGVELRARHWRRFGSRAAAIAES
ncbi:MAG: PAS domain-containing protein [Nitrospira sp.]|nr:PAS domain-containing protein [Nitrospira sp.]